MENRIPTIDEIVKEYNALPIVMHDSLRDSDRAEGGIQRSHKGSFVEKLARVLVGNAWRDLGGDMNDIRLTKGSVTVPIKKEYIENLQDEDVKNHILSHIENYTYSFRIDVPVYIKEELIMAIECKAYAENAMLKRVLFDGSLIKEIYPRTEIVLFQLESQLGGDYSDIFKDIHYGSTSTHTLMSYFGYTLHILTLLEGERHVDRPIHKAEFSKHLRKQSLENVVDFFKKQLEQYV